MNFEIKFNLFKALLTIIINEMEGNIPNE